MPRRRDTGTAAMDDPLGCFRPVIREWFSREIGDPTPVQGRAWKEISGGGHALIIAPTGSGKTLSAFLWAIDRLASGAWTGGCVRVLYVSPLKALNSDIRRNLLAPLGAIAQAFDAAGEPFPGIQVQTRSGDTPEGERRRMLRRPPEILITTPESLNILLTSASGRAMLGGLATVILDEIHALWHTRRGTHLITAVERLTLMSGEFQRIGLSATVRPAGAVARFMGGQAMTGPPEAPAYRPRPVAVIRDSGVRPLAIQVHAPPDQRPIWPYLAERFRGIIRQNRATLLFCNSRRTVERTARLLNEGEPRPLAYAHHGSLSRETRLAVESRLKRRDLKAVVATNSLELGIDIGELDRVILIGSPPSAASGLQRVGRSGHRVGGTGLGEIFTTHSRDILDAAVLARCMAERDIAVTRPVDAPLDVLAQVILSLCVGETWNLDRLFAVIRTAFPYRGLTRSQFDRVVEMLAGRYAGTRVKALAPRLSVDRLDKTATALNAAAGLIYLSGGTIPDRGYYTLRRQDTGARIGELDEEFVWERRIGETFAFGTQQWRIQRITPDAVEVTPAAGSGMIPFWRGEARYRDAHFIRRLSRLLERADALLPQDADAFLEEMVARHCLVPEAARRLAGFLVRQKEVTRAGLPHRSHILVERSQEDRSRGDAQPIILHTFWGGRINHPLALALSAAWAEWGRGDLPTLADDDAILIRMPPHEDPLALIARVSSADVIRLIEAALGRTGLFAACFRECAGRALLLPRAGFNRRVPLWMTRLRAGQLLESVRPHPDFPILTEAWRTCMMEMFDIQGLRRRLRELDSGDIRVSETHPPSPSPFAEGLIWQETNVRMYQPDAGIAGLSPAEERSYDLGAGGRPEIRVPDRLIQELASRIHRTADGYAPRTGADLLEWIKERRWLPQREWQDLISAVERESGKPAEAVLSHIGARLVRVVLKNGGAGVAAREDLPLIQDALVGAIDAVLRLSDGTVLSEAEIQGIRTRRDLPVSPDGAMIAFLDEWLAHQGPMSLERISESLGLSPPDLEPGLLALARERRVIHDRFRETADGVEFCHRDVWEILLRMARRHRRPALAPLPAALLPLVLAQLQGLTRPGRTPSDLRARMEQLLGYPAPASAWETLLLPVRFTPFRPAELDALFHEEALGWFGCGREQLFFAFREDLDLLQGPVSKTPPEIARLFPHLHGSFRLFELAGHAGLDTRETAYALWDLAWKGWVSNDGFAVVRTGIETGFKPEPAAAETRSPGRGRGRFNRWRASRPLAGSWFVVRPEDARPDSLDSHEHLREAARQVLARYGVVFRELTERELPRLRWSRIFQVLRLMELSGEVIAGQFFEGVSGPQFMCADAFRLFCGRDFHTDAVYWVSATDPASVCGLKISGLPDPPPARLPSTFLVYHGSALVMVLKQNGREVAIGSGCAPDHLTRYLGVFHGLDSREVRPQRRIDIQRIDGRPALDSPWAACFLENGFETDGLLLTLRGPL